MSISKHIKGRITLIFFFILFCCFDIKLNAQGPPPPPVLISVVSVILAISFGTLCDQGLPGGSVNINAQTGTRTPSDIVTFGSFARAEYNLVGNDGTLVTFSYPPNIILSRDGGGETIDLSLDVFPPVYIILKGSPVTDKLYVGGTLTLTGVAPAGTYNSTDFVITLNQP
jgi:hypothetical protein